MSDHELDERQRTNDLLESMISQLESDEDDDDPRTEWMVPLDEEDGEQGQDEGEDEDEDDDDDEDFYIDEDEFDEEFMEDEDAFLEMEADEVEEGDGDDDEDQDGDFSALLQAVAARMGDDGQGEGNGAAEVLRRLFASGRIQIRRAHAAAQGGGDDDDDDDDEESYSYGGMGRRGRATPIKDFWDPVKEPIKAGQELYYGGEFGRPPPRPLGAPQSAFQPSYNLVDKLASRRCALSRIEKDELFDYVPNSNGTEVAKYPARSYCGQYSEDSSFFYTCTQDFKVHLYDTTASPSRVVRRHADADSRRTRYHVSMATDHFTSLKPIKTIQGRHGTWTVTDANLSPDNKWMIYSSINPYVHLVSTTQDIESGGRSHNEQQVMLDFSNREDDEAGIWSIRFSGDSREIVAGAHFGEIYVFDIEARKRVLKVEGHADDVNGVAFADSASSNVLISGSDDSFVKVWDRRSLSGGKPAGVLPGHTEGITFVAPKGDGRYCISNGKDQSTKLWDLRMMVSSQDFDRMPKVHYGLRQWDYRSMPYKKPRYQAHPEDRSVMTYRGHAVLRTLIRCHFSPIATTGQRYIYSGSADGRIHIWSLDGQVVQVLDRSKAVPLKQLNGEASDPSAPIPSQRETLSARQRQEEESRMAADRYRRPYMYSGGGAQSTTVRDVSWHSSEPALMSTAWDGPAGEEGSVAKHEWKGFGKNGLNLEDAIERCRQESAR
ncbi:WD40 repeat-like protein [Acaromyces ingoldii]|uniref:WD40 repeat-like protein n=1 Tax=Acaromyces ingoldii TaxID=215250 RepID=A0A316YPH1_9BASI|nr:WD40 repeat-like protein [Acaromyces ingoldii]PWN89953.1 WD40 repeat-like protein [Acaromyces ingoldii]